MLNLVAYALKRPVLNLKMKFYKKNTCICTGHKIFLHRLTQQTEFASCTFTAFICLIFNTIDIYEKTDPLISQTRAWAVCPRGSSQFISRDKERQARACVATAPGAAGRFDMGGILFPSTGLDPRESVLGVGIGICLGCFMAANATEFHPNCLPC